MEHNIFECERNDEINICKYCVDARSFIFAWNRQMIKSSMENVMSRENCILFLFICQDEKLAVFQKIESPVIIIPENTSGTTTLNQ